MLRCSILLALGACAVEPLEANDPVLADPDPADTGEPESPVDTGSPAPDGDVVTLTVDATSRDAFVYVDLDNAEVLDASSADSSDWELALRRFVIRTNGGTSGPGSVQAGLAFDPPGLYADDEPLLDGFLALDESEALDWLTSELEPASLSSDAVEGVFADDWYDYDPATGVASANSDVGWVIRGGEGTSYARVRLTELDFPTREGEGIKSFTVSVEVEGPSGLGTPVDFVGSVPGTGGEVCFDMDAGANVDCTGPAWDLRLGFSGRDTFLYTNSGAAGDGEGGALGPYDWTELETWTRASENPSGDDLSAFFEVDDTESAFTIDPWYAYNLQGQFRLTPNYRVYEVSAGEDGPRWAVQVVDYYDEAQVSGNVTLRFVEL